jgi:RNA polymerase sigma factor (sigma-70 family)
MRDPAASRLSNLALSKKFRVRSETIGLWRRNLGISRKEFGTKLPKKGHGYRNNLSHQEREDLVKKCLPLAHLKVKRLIARMPRYAHLFDDLIAEGMYMLWFASARFRPEKGYSFSSYAMTCMDRHLCRYLGRMQFAESMHPEKDEMPIGSMQADQEDDLIYEETWAKLLDAIPKQFQDAFRMHYQDGMTYAQIGRQLGYSPQRAAQVCQLAIAHIHERYTFDCLA